MRLTYIFWIYFTQYDFTQIHSFVEFVAILVLCLLVFILVVRIGSFRALLCSVWLWMMTLEILKILYSCNMLLQWIFQELHCIFNFEHKHYRFCRPCYGEYLRNQVQYFLYLLCSLLFGSASIHYCLLNLIGNYLL